MELFDSHCHLQFKQLADNLDQVLKDADADGVKRYLCVGTDLPDSQTAINIAAGHENIWATAGVHPHGATEFLDDKNAAQKLGELLGQPKVVAVGEVGLDFYKNHSPKDDQQKLLRQQIELGGPTGLPFVFHVRDAWEGFWPIFDSYSGLRGVVHSFSAAPKHLDEALSRGLYVALNGIMTFTDDQTQLEAAKLVPEDRLLLESDAPFLAPKAYRGQTCEPKHILDTAIFLASLRGEAIDELAAYTTKNARELFKI